MCTSVYIYIDGMQHIHTITHPVKSPYMHACTPVWGSAIHAPSAPPLFDYVAAIANSGSLTPISLSRLELQP